MNKRVNKLYINILANLLTPREIINILIPQSYPQSENMAGGRQSFTKSCKKGIKRGEIVKFLAKLLQNPGKLNTLL